MKFYKILPALLVLSCSICVNGSLLNDFFKSASNFWPKKHELGSHQTKQLTSIRFELPAETEEFLREGLALINAPANALDVCSHRVILQLKKDCNKLSKDDIGKLAVMLMNCEFEAEGRPTFACTPEMTLTQCKIAFDTELIAIHALMNNRALAVCAALKQDQFKMATEAAVNQLMMLAAQQSQVVQAALQNQRRANEISLQNIHEFEDNHAKIKESQTQNMEHISSAKDQLGEINSDLQRIYEMNQHTEQKTISIEKLANDIALQLENSATRIQKQNDEAQEFMERFKHIMQVISAITRTLELTFSKIEEILSEIGLEVTQEFMVNFLLNILYFTCGMVFIIFMEMRDRFKHILIGLFIFNTLASYFNSDIPVSSLNIFIWLVYSCYNFSGILKEKFFMCVDKILKFLRIRKERDLREKSVSRARSMTPFFDDRDKQNKPPPTKKTKKSKVNNNEEEEEDEELAELCAKEMEKIENTIAAKQTQQPQVTPVRSETPINLNRPMTPAMLRVMSTESGQLNDRSATPFNAGMPGRIQCQAYTKLGAQCRNAALIGYSKCRVHNYA